MRDANVDPDQSQKFFKVNFSVVSWLHSLSVTFYPLTSEEELWDVRKYTFLDVN